MKFKVIAVATALISCALGLGYLLAGELILGRWQILPAESVLLLGRRLGALYLGLAVMFFLARSAPASTGRKALSGGAAVGLSLLALLGVYEFGAGRVGPGILVSVLVEAVLAFMYVLLFFAERGKMIKSERAEVEQI